MNNLSLSIHNFFLWVQFFMASDFRSMRVTGRRSNVGLLIKTQSGKTFLQQSSKGKKQMHQNDYHSLDHQVKIIGGPNKGGASKFSEICCSSVLLIWSLTNIVVFFKFLFQFYNLSKRGSQLIVSRAMASTYQVKSV